MLNQRSWTPDQRAAIEKRGGNILVAAAAGTGKTAVLVERVKGWVCQPPQVDIDRLLVVTFTEAAAAEIRERLTQSFLAALERDPENEHLRRQLSLIAQAPISTLHSFCLRLVRRYFYLLGLDPNFRVAGEEEALLLQLEALAEVLEEGYARDPEGLARLVEGYGGGWGDEALQDLILRLYRFSRSHPDPQGWLEGMAAGFARATESSLEELPWMRGLVKALRLELQDIAALLEEAEGLVAAFPQLAGYREVIAAERDGVEELLTSLPRQSWEEWRRRLASFAFGRLPAVRLGKDQPRVGWAKEVARQVRERAKELLGRLKEEYGGLGAEELLEGLARVAPLVRTLVDLTLRFDRAYQAAKEGRGVVDFADLEHAALRLLDEWPREELQREFVEVVVDEYQDINEVQEAILARLAPEKLFLVGDARQSIYRFRLAEPRLFLAKYARYRRGEGGVCLHLTVNFRSRRHIIDAVNFLFRQLMNPEVVELDYSQAAELVYGASYPAEADKTTARGPVEVYLLEAEDGQEEEKGRLEREAELVAARLRAMVEGVPGRPGPEFWVYENGAYVPVSYRHLAVLLRATRDRANVFLEAFRRFGVPARADLSSGYFAAPEVRVVLALLRIIDNPRQDIPLAAVLRSPILGLSDAELAQIRLCRRQGSFFEALVLASRGQVPAELAAKLRRFLAELEQWRTLARRQPLPEVIWQLLWATGYYSFVGSLPGGEERQANLRGLVERARHFAVLGQQGLGAFLRFLDRLEASEVDFGAAGTTADQADAVRVLSVHKAKGLEFPVVVVADLGRQFNLSELKGDLLLHRDLGLGPMVVDTELRYKYPTLAYRAIREASRREVLAEEMRILYVALTRAREHLILVGSTRGLAGKAAFWARAAGQQGWVLAPGWLRGAYSYLDWLGPALARHRQGQPLRDLGGYGGPMAEAAVAADPSRWQIVCGPPAWLAEVREKARAGVAGAPLQGAAKVAAPRPAEGGLAAGIAAKVTVSELLRTSTQADEGEPPARPLWRSKLGEKPEFLAGASQAGGTLRGAATHLLLQHLDLTGTLDEADMRQQAAALVERGILSPEMVQLLDLASLAAFWQSPLGQRLKAGAARVRRELSFSVGLPAATVYPHLADTEAGKEIVLVQGVLDLLGEEEDGFLLVEFKTEQPTWAQAAHKRQLELYALAVERVFGRPVKEAYLVYLGSGDVVRLPLGEGRCHIEPAGKNP